MTDDEARTELERLVELDYERTASFITGVTGTSSTIRGWAVTIWLAIVGIGVDRGDWRFPAAALVVTFAFFLLDAYHANLYRQAVDHAASVERVTGQYFALLGRGTDDEDAAVEADVALQSHLFGLYRSLRPFRLRDLRFVRPLVFFVGFYGVQVAVALGLGVVLLLTTDDQTKPCDIRLLPDATTTISCPAFNVTTGSPHPSSTMASPTPAIETPTSSLLVTAPPAAPSPRPPNSAVPVDGHG